MILTDQRSSEVAERLRSAVEEALSSRNLSARRASLDVVGHDGLIRDIRAGRIPSVDRIEALFEYLGLEAYFGPRREEAPPSRGPLINVTPDHDAPAGYLTIPWAEAGVRPGSAPVAFSRMWLADHALTPDHLQAVQPDRVDLGGSQGQDTIALLDIRAMLRTGHGLFCFREGRALRVSHVTFEGPLTIIHPASPAEDPRLLQGAQSRNLAFLGKVVWLGQSIPFHGTIS